MVNIFVAVEISIINYFALVNNNLRKNKKYKLQTAYKIRIYNYGVLKLIRNFKRMKNILYWIWIRNFKCFHFFGFDTLHIRDILYHCNMLQLLVLPTETMFHPLLNILKFIIHVAHWWCKHFLRDFPRLLILKSMLTSTWQPFRLRMTHLLCKQVMTYCTISPEHFNTETEDCINNICVRRLNASLQRYRGWCALL